jgi:hypothetical protein
MKTGKTLEDGWKRSYQKQNYGLKIYLEVIERKNCGKIGLIKGRTK